MVTIQMPRRVLIVLVAIAAIAAVIAATGRSHRSDRRDNVAQSAEFLHADFGDELALLSDPVDITEPGHYVLRAGPLAATVPTDLQVGGGMSPGDEQRFVDMREDRGLRGGVDVGPKIVETNGSRYAVIGLTVTEVRMPYYGYRAWVSLRKPERLAG